jgi:aminodeoxyfutalosine deaminase
MQESPRYLYRAPFVLPCDGRPTIVDGGVLTEEGVVRAVGPYGEVRAAAPADTPLEDYEGHVIVPALLNCHAHLELSCLSRLSSGRGPGQAGSLVAWVRELLAAREQAGEGDSPQHAALMALARLYAGGCRMVLDIGNQEESAGLGRDFKTEVFFFLELLGLCGAAQEAALARLAALPGETACTAHAPYSAGAALLCRLKERAREQGGLLPLHVAESAAEIEFLRSGQGEFRDFLRERGLALDSFAVPGCGAVRYLDSLGILDEGTLCVHGVHVDEEEIDLLARRGAAVCLCPGSNRFLGVGRAPVLSYLARGVPLVLGTDSLASNPQLNLWEEMRILRAEHGGLAPEAVFAMATSNAARLLGLAARLGRIAPGVSASLPAVRCSAASAGEALEYLTTAGGEITLEWLE